ncbi:MAG: hypothetical protein E6G05_08605 [Actinobacteria bacterium]|nr:MAG: hypothetical protein E6G05_08605 [Actinomycetota bacterium]
MDAPVDSVTIRHAFPDDALALVRLAALDSAEVPSQPLIVAEVNGELRAALSLHDGAVIADPFHRTEPLVELLCSRAAQLSATEALPRDTRSRRGSRGVFIARLRGNA